MAGKTGEKVTSKGRLITRSITNTRPVDMTLNLDCTDEPLSEAQLASLSRSKENYDKIKLKIEEIIKENNAQLIAQSGPVNAYQYSLPQPSVPTILKPVTQPPTATIITQNPQKSHPLKLNVLNNATNQQGNLQLVMDPRMGVILSTVNSQQNNLQNNSQNQVQKLPTAAPTTTTTVVDNSNQYIRPTRQTTARTSSKVLQVHQPDIIEEPVTAPTLRVRQKAQSTTQGVVLSQNQQQASSQNLIKLKQTTRQQQSSNTRPTEQTSIGGIAVGVKNPTNDTIDETKKNLPDGREIAFNKGNGGRTYPSLVVVARPHLRVKDMSASIASKERSELDAKVKNILMYTPTRFAEWLIQQGLVKSEQYCNQHKSYPQPKLKLGMYSDTGTFPYSGGYVWVSSCCVDRFVSVFSGSIFQGSPHLPTILLKLIYHWSCQTSVQNVISWVKVTNVYVKNFYTNLRSICTAAVWDKSKLMGGKNWNIQVGVISLGTTSQDGNLRQVKVEVLGILNVENGLIRLRACDPVQDTDRTYRRRFNHILQPLKDWVHKDSRILTDFTVDKATLTELGFNNVVQVAYTDQSARSGLTNYQIMEYLRKIVPRMFQNTLSLLSRSMIQQFLDELVWREMFGTTSSRAFHNIITHIGEQTRSLTNENLLDRLAKISANPFQNWSYSNNGNGDLAYSSTNDVTPVLSVKQNTTGTHNNYKRSRKRAPVNRGISPEPDNKRAKSPDNKIIDKKDQISLHEFYYSIVEGDKLNSVKEDKRVINFSCFLCSTILKSNIEIMEHMIRHVPPPVPGQVDTHVCRYCCAIFSSKHQMVTHVTEAHSTFGNSDGDMLVCGICEQIFANSNLLVEHMMMKHVQSEMPYRCDCCGYRTSSHKDVIDHFYNVHDKGEHLQCPYCLKLINCYDGGSSTSSNNIHAYLIHMQRHLVRRPCGKEQGAGNKCSRCCLWFNQKSSLKFHQAEHHNSWIGFKKSPPITTDKNIIISKSRHQSRRYIEVDNPTTELPDDVELNKWADGPITINAPNSSFGCQECEEDICEEDHYPGEQRCTQCRYVTCCWRAFREHQQQIHNERPMTSLVVPPPLINIPLERIMKCRCGFSTKDGNLIAKHFVKCSAARKLKASGEKRGSSGMLDSLGLVPKNI